MIRINGIWQELVSFNGRTFTVRQSDGATLTYRRVRRYTGLDFYDGIVPVGFNAIGNAE